MRVIAPYVGGGFGGKEDMTVEPYLALAVWRTRRPVQMQWSRQESLLARPKRHAMLLRYRTAARADGTILGQEVDMTADSGAYAYLSALVLLYSSVHACGPYRVDNVRLRARCAYTNNPPTSAFRGFGGMQVVFGYESQMDLLARRLGIPPADIRKRNAWPGATFCRWAADRDRGAAGQTIDAVCDGGDKPRAVRAAPRGGPRHRLQHRSPTAGSVWLQRLSGGLGRLAAGRQPAPSAAACPTSAAGRRRRWRRSPPRCSARRWIGSPCTSATRR